MGRYATLLAIAATAAVTMSVLVGCMSVGIRTTGAGSVGDLKAEDAYLRVYIDHMSALKRDFEVFAASGSDPGVCNKGGTKQGCFDADSTVIDDLDAMLKALQATTVPPRFIDADRLLRDAITTNIRGLELRNQAIANNDDTAWKQHGPLLDQAGTSWTAAYAAFPSDNRPALAP